MTTPTPSRLPKSLKDLRTTHAGNVKNAKFSISYAGEGDSGKSWCLCSFALSGDDGIVIAMPRGENTETHEKLIRMGFPLELVHINNWDEFANGFVPAVSNREIKASAIGIEGIHFLTSAMWREIQGDKTELDTSEWTIGKNRLIDVFTDLRSATQPSEGKRNYHLIVTTHLKDIMVKAKGQQAVLDRVRPAIDGQFKDIFNRIFGTNLLCETKLVGTVTKVDGADKVVKKKQYVCHTTPPTSLHICGDKVGGGVTEMPGAERFKHTGFNPLPPEVDGTFHGLCEAWGCDPKTLQPIETNK